MAACPPIDGDSLDSDNFVSTPSLQTPKVFPNNSQIKSSSSRGNSKDYPLDSEEAYDKVASFEEAALKKLLEEVVCQKQNKNDKSAIAQLLIKKEEDALREESGSGEDTTEQRLKRQKKKKSICRKDHCVSHLGCSAAARNNTGGSLGSLQNLTDQKVPEQTNTNTQGVAARSRAGGSCGNLSKGSFETHTCKRRNRRSKEINRASTSQREGGSLQNLSKTEAASNEAKKLHKSGSLSQVFSDVGGVRLKNRRQKTSSESSSTRTFTRRSEDREPPESSEDEVGEFPYTRLPPSSHSSVSGHSCDTGENLVVMVGGGRWNGDHMSDVASGETTEEDGESSMHVTARAKLGDSSRHHHHDGSDTELHSVISHTAHRDVLPTISSDSEVDKPVNFGLCKNQEEAMSSSTSLPYTSVKSVFETKATSKDDEVNEKRKLRNSKSENGSYEKSSYDENGNSVFMSVRSSLSGGNSGSSISSNCSSSSTTTTTTTTGAPIYSSVSCNDRHSSNSLAIGSSKKNSYTPVNNSKDGSNYNRLKAKQDKKKAIKEKDVMPSEKTPGFRGSDPLDAILKFLGAENSTSSKSKKKNKSKKEEDKDGARNRKTKSLDKTSTEDSDFENIRFDDNFGKTKYEDDGNNVNDIKERKDEEGRRNKKNQDKKRGKKGSGLRESSSVEDLVSKSKQINDVKEVRKHVTVDDGELSPFHCHSSSKSNYSLENKAKSEFSCDFYKVGDALLESEPASIESGDFEIVSRKKGKKARNSSTSTYNSTTVSQGSRVGGSSGSWTSSTNYSSTYTSDDQRRATFPRSNPTPRNSSSKTSSQDKPQINFSEGPFTVHDGVFLSQFSGNRSSAGGERYTTTTSVPHSEDSDSDGGDSVHSMPAHVITPRPHVRKPPPSTDSTPQASYANIAKLAAVSTSKSQTKKNSTVNPSGNPVGVSEEENYQANEEPVLNQQEPKVKLPSSILDDFPPLIGGTSSSAGGAINNNNSSNSSSSNNNSASIITSENINNPSIGNLPQDSSFPVVKDLKILNYSSDASVGETTVKTPSFSNSSGICSSSSSGSSNMSFTVNETTNSTSKLQHNNNLSKYTSTSVSQCSFVEPLSHYASNNNNNTNNFNNNNNNNNNNNINTPIISNKPVVPHTQPHIEQQPKQKQPSPPHQKQQPTVIYNTALSQKLSQHTQSLKFINQSIKSNKSKVVCSLTSSMQHQPVSINYSSNRGNSVVKSERNKNTVPKEKTNNVNYNLKSSKTKDSTETSSGGNNIKNNKRYEAAVIFTDNAKFDLTNFEIEFGFDVTLENLTNLADNVVESPNFTNTSVISNDTTINIKNLISDTTNTTAATTTTSNNNKSKNFHPPVDFSKFYQAPVNDVISYNYEELCRHVYKGWESVLQMLEEDPKNIQYWKATDGDSGNNTVKN